MIWFVFCFMFCQFIGCHSKLYSLDFCALYDLYNLSLSDFVSRTFLLFCWSFLYVMWEDSALKVGRFCSRKERGISNNLQTGLNVLSVRMNLEHTELTRLQVVYLISSLAHFACLNQIKSIHKTWAWTWRAQYKTGICDADAAVVSVIK